jgi:hypothetical protein
MTGKDPERTIRIPQQWTYLAALGDDQLLPKAEILGDQSRTGLEAGGEGEKKVPKHRW